MSEITKTEYHGHKTMADGSRVPLTKDEVADLVAKIEESAAKRQTDMPTVRDALSMLCDAEQRLRELGWWRGGGLRVRRGDACAVIQHGSTGMWSGRYQEDGEYVLFGDSVCRPRDCWMKPLSDLTPDERAWMEECDQKEREAQDAFARRCQLLAAHRDEAKEEGR